MPAAAQLSVATDCLRGNAHDWGVSEVRRGSMRSYTDFRRALLAEYWTDDRQEMAKLEILRSRWSRDAGVGMAEWLVSMTRRAQLLDPPLPEERLAATLAHHFPESVSTTLLADGHLTLDSMRQYLRRMDSAKEWHRVMTVGHSSASRSGQPRPRPGSPVQVSAVQVHSSSESAGEGTAEKNRRKRRRGRRSSDHLREARRTAAPTASPPGVR